MRTRFPIRTGRLAAAAAIACAWSALPAQTAPVVLDRVVAVVNNQPILMSDVRDELRLAALEPRDPSEGAPNEQNALQDLISRDLIRQQIRQQDIQAAQPNPEKVQQRLAELRRELPECAQLHCNTDQGWKQFLQQHGLTSEEVENYLRMRMETLSFIEDRFRQGIRIPQEDIEKYYRETLLPRYPKGQRPPPLDSVSTRIEAILLEQRVNQLFDTWLNDLRKQGDVEVLDPALKTPADASDGDGAAQ